ncbi:hypothetical protein FACS1894126_0290 [Alphaproteobacteria bacterium]|nr:hypothetical protein FACS1894126_0290 [Alphaproteobacteria bacterium]
MLRFREMMHFISERADYVLRKCDNLNIEVDGNKLNLKDFSGETQKFKAYVPAWKKEAIFEVKTKNGSIWFLFSSLSDDKSFSEIYEKRFGIEKRFQDQKSSGFDIEKTKIRKYDRFKRLYFSMCLAQLFAVLVGEYVQNNNHPLKKNFIFLRTCYQHFQAWMVVCKLFFKQAIRLIAKKIHRLL